MKLYMQDSNCRFVPADESAVMDCAAAIVSRKMRRGARFDAPATAREVIAQRIGHLEAEVFCVAFLDTRHRLIEWREMFQGTINGASVHPREVAKAALELNAAAVILAHNHPSGEPEPSNADELITQRLKETLALIDCRVLDHVIAAGNETFSFAHTGLV